MNSLTRLLGKLGTLRRHRAVRAVGLMASTSAIGQIAVFGALPLLTRLYEPQAFGQHSLFMAFVGVATVCACLCLDTRVVSTDDESQADEVYAAAVMAVGMTALAATAVFTTFILLDAFGYGALSPWAAPAMAAMVAMNGLYTASRSRVIREQDFRLVARTGLLQNLGRAVAPLALYPLAPFWLGLTGGELAGRALGVRRIAQPLWPRLRRAQVWGRFDRWRQLVRREYRFTAVLTTTVFIDAVASQMIAPLLAATYGAHAAGEYFVASLVIVAPSILIGAGAADVLHARGAEIFRTRPQDLPHFTRKAAAGLLLLGLAIFVPLHLAAPHVLPWIVGAKWPDLARTVQGLTPFAVAGFVASPCSRLLGSVNRPLLKVVSDLIRLIGVPLTIQLGASAEAPFIDTVRHLGWFLAAAYGLYFLLTYSAVVASSRHRPPPARWPGT